MGECRGKLAEVDQLLFGAFIEESAARLAYQRWKLHHAAEPKFVPDPRPYIPPLEDSFEYAWQQAKLSVPPSPPHLSRAAAGGIIWGNMLGASALLSLVGLKVFPVVILGGLDSLGGAIVGGLIMGAVESVAARSRTVDANVGSER